MLASWWPCSPKMFRFRPQGSNTRDLADPAPMGSLPSWEREASLLHSKPFNWRKKKVIINIKAKASSPLKGRTCREQSRDRNPPGLEHEHFHYEIFQKQNEGLGARIALKFKSGCLTLPCTLGNLGGNAG